MHIENGSAIISAEEYVALRELKATFEHKVKANADELKAAKKDLNDKVDKIRWKDPVTFKRYSLSDWALSGPIECQYIGKDEAIARLTERLNEALKPKNEVPEIERATLGRRLKFLFTGI